MAIKKCCVPYRQQRHKKLLNTIESHKDNSPQTNVTEVPSNDVIINIFDGNHENDDGFQRSRTLNHPELNFHKWIWLPIFLFISWKLGCLSSILRSASKILWRAVKFFYNHMTA